MLNLEFTRDNIPKAFWDSLGKYVYGYKDADGNWEYIGKGTGRRIKSHVKTKELDLDDAWIIARNLEDFEGKSDSHSFSIESLLIQLYNPELNSVSGHYKDNFVMASLKGLFGDFVSGEMNYHYEMVEFLTRNRDTLESMVAHTESNNGGFTIRSSGRDGHVVRMGMSDGDYFVSITYTGDSKKGGTVNKDRYDSTYAALNDRIGEEYEIISEYTSNGGRATWGVEDEETMLNFWFELLS